MGKVILGTTMSLDGFTNDRNGSVEALYPDLAALRETEPLQQSIQNTGAVVMGWNSFAMAEDPDSLVTDGLENAVRQAQAAAGDKDVTVIGVPNTSRQCLQAGR